MEIRKQLCQPWLAIQRTVIARFPPSFIRQWKVQEVSTLTGDEERARTQEISDSDLGSGLELTTTPAGLRGSFRSPDPGSLNPVPIATVPSPRTWELLLIWLPVPEMFQDPERAIRSRNKEEKKKAVCENWHHR